MKHLIFGLCIVLFFVVATVGAASLVAFVGLAVTKLNPVWLLGTLFTALCVAACSKIMDWLMNL